ncbi:MAG: peptidoglycan-binding protein [Candidatus Nanopelagicales bacterium]
MAGDKSVIYNPTLPGTSIVFPGGLRKGPTGELLLHCAAQLHSRVENGGTGYGMWGYAYRDIRGFLLSPADRKLMAAAIQPGLDDLTPIHSANRPCCFDNEDTLLAASSLSNHSSGTAFDWAAPKHPLGKIGTFTAAQVKTIHTIVNVECEGCIRWGGDYSGRKDEMHFEIIKSEAECQRVLNKLRKGSSTTSPSTGTRVLYYDPSKPIMTGKDVEDLQRVLNAWYKTARPVWWPLTVDGRYGPASVVAVKYLQQRAKLTVDGEAGPAVRKALGL